jgi:hypothetical protein
MTDHYCVPRPHHLPPAQLQAAHSLAIVRIETRIDD